MNGVVILDKPAGRTSHDVVQRVRKLLGTRSVGHAGTLDPLATGVLVVAIGEGTKLVPYMQQEDKRYEVAVRLGVETDSLDADGTVTETAPIPFFGKERVEGAVREFVGRRPQRVPKLSAIKVEGTPLHRRVRRGEDVEAPLRTVELYSVSVMQVGDEEMKLSLHCGKGFYVRAFVRDLARALGTLGHVAALRRTASGRFTLAGAIPYDGLTADRLLEALIPLSEACASLRRIELTEEGVADARHGRPVPASRLVGGGWREAESGEPLALVAGEGQVLVAIGRREEEHVRVIRGFAPDASSGGGG